MIIDINSKKPEPTQLHAAIRAWFDALNKARVSKDPIDAARINPAPQAVGQAMGHIKTGHVRPKPEMVPLILIIDLMFAMGPHLSVATQASRGTARRLVQLMRDLESDARGMLAQATGEPVEPRSLANDEAEDRMLGGS